MIGIDLSPDILNMYQGIKTIVGSQAFVRLLTTDNSVVVESRFRFPEYMGNVSNYFNDITRLVGDQGKTRLVAQKESYNDYVTVLINAVFKG